jgi:hypothetical protein
MVEPLTIKHKQTGSWKFIFSLSALQNLYFVTISPSPLLPFSLSPSVLCGEYKTQT